LTGVAWDRASGGGGLPSLARFLLSARYVDRIFRLGYADRVGKFLF